MSWTAGLYHGQPQSNVGKDVPEHKPRRRRKRSRVRKTGECLARNGTLATSLNNTGTYCMRIGGGQQEEGGGKSSCRQTNGKGAGPNVAQEAEGDADRQGVGRREEGEEEQDSSTNSASGCKRAVPTA